MYYIRADVPAAVRFGLMTSFSESGSISAAHPVGTISGFECIAFSSVVQYQDLSALHSVVWYVLADVLVAALFSLMTSVSESWSRSAAHPVGAILDFECIAFDSVVHTCRCAHSGALWPHNLIFIIQVNKRCPSCWCNISL